MNKFLHNDDIEKYVFEHSKSEDVFLTELIDETRQFTSYPEMMSGRVVGNLLKLLVASIGAKKVLEIGTFTGFSALCMAESLPPDGKLITCEIDPKPLEIARKYFNKSAHGHKIKIELGKALETVNNFPKDILETFDFAFIDADKANYLEYYKVVLKLIKPGGLIVLDNALWGGKVVNPSDVASIAIANTNEYILNDPTVENVLLTVRDGLNIVRKLIIKTSLS